MQSLWQDSILVDWNIEYSNPIDSDHNECKRRIKEHITSLMKHVKVVFHRPLLRF